MRAMVVLSLALLTACSPESGEVVHGGSDALDSATDGAVPDGGVDGAQDDAFDASDASEAGDTSAMDTDSADDPASDAETSDDGTDAGDGEDADASDDSGDSGASCGEVRAVDGLVLGTTSGPFAGLREDDARVWRGIPFAAAPVGPLRFRPPEPAACVDEVRDAFAFGPECLQRDERGRATGSEDCLYLNVWLPDTAPPASGWPVLFWIHGGGNVQGSASVPILPLAGAAPLYDGRRLAAEGPAVVVTVQYRLGPMGYLALPELADESPVGTTGNYGLLDLVAALEWVHANAPALGADVSRVMVFGESAGGVNTCALLASPLARGLFARAAIQSGGCPATPIAAATARHGARVDASSCGDAADRVACLRGLPTATVLSELGGTISIGSPGTDATGSYGPVVDGHVLDDDPIVAISNAAQASVLVGSNAEELATLIAVTVASDEELRDVVEASYGFLGEVAVDAVMTEYNAANYGTSQLALEMLLADARFHCSALRIADAAVRGGQQAWRYWFSRRYPARDGERPAAHGVELFYVFGTIGDLPGAGAPPADVAQSEAMRAAWLRFGATGDPNPTSPAWPAWSAAAEVLEWDSTVRVIDDPRAAQCELLLGLLGLE